MNVTPLVDVVLVLLIIFMVVIPQMEAGATVNVPGAANPDAQTDLKNPPITLSMTAAGGLYLEKRGVTRDELMPLLRQARAASPRSKLVLKGDRAVSYGAMRALFRECQGIGFPGVSLQVGDKSSGES
ncbi:MAG: biopolymer transporter ExbD [Myxococcales bacterium]|nr:biopolymer transporter ExbD [Myxococcales bacterium]